MRVAMLGLSMLVLSGCGTVTKNIREANAPQDTPLSLQASAQTTPLEIYAWISGHINYVSDINPEDEFRTPEKTLSLGYGDCDDVAVLADDLLKKHGYDSEVITVYTAQEGHTVCVWKDAQGKYNSLSNKTYRETHSANLKDIATDVYPDWQTIVHYPDNSYEVRN